MDPLLSEVGGGAVYKSGEGDVTDTGCFGGGDVHVSVESWHGPYMYITPTN